MKYVKAGIDDKSYNRLQQICKADGISMAQYVRNIVEAEIARSKVQMVRPNTEKKITQFVTEGIRKQLSDEFRGYFSTWEEDERYSGATEAAIAIIEGLDKIPDTEVEAIFDAFEMFMRMLRSGHITREDLVEVLQNLAIKVSRWNGYPLKCPSGCGRKWTKYAPYSEYDTGYNPSADGTFVCSCGYKGHWH